MASWWCPWSSMRASAARRGGLGLVGGGAAAAHTPTVLGGTVRAGVAEGFGVGQHRIDFPPLSIGTGDPDLVLGGETAGGADLLFGYRAGLGQPGDLGMYDLTRIDLHPQMVEGAALTGVFQQDQLQRWIGDREVGVTRLAFGRFGLKQLGVEADCGVEIVDVEGELNTRHGSEPPSCETYIEL